MSPQNLFGGLTQQHDGKFLLTDVMGEVLGSTAQMYW